MASLLSAVQVPRLPFHLAFHPALSGGWMSCMLSSEALVLRQEHEEPALWRSVWKMSP